MNGNNIIDDHYNGFTWDQVKGPLDRIALASITYILGRLKLDASLTTDIAALIVLAGGGFYGWWVNRPKAIKQSAVAIPGTLVVEAKPGMSLGTMAGAIAQSVTVSRVLAPKVSADSQTNTKVQEA